MLFNSFEFIVLVLSTFILYYLNFLRNFQVAILILASFIFYSFANLSLLLLLFSSASINAITSYMAVYTKSKNKFFYAITGVIVNLSVLFFFKYTIMVGNTIKELFLFKSLSDFLIQIPLPIGISFFTFQGISLIIDTYRGAKNAKTEYPLIKKNFFAHYFDTLFFISFFPQLVAGPIVKAKVFYPQISKKYFFDVDFFGVIKILILGYFFKIFVADNLSEFTYLIYTPLPEYESRFTLILLLYAFSVQIFADFAGYSLIAIGTAKLFGYNLPVNFNYPYISKSISEFWTRWHISLSSWLKDYLYIPLGGNKKGQTKTYANLMIVMCLGGFWHGASISFLVWGFYHGALLVIERILSKKINIPNNFLFNILKILLVFSLVTLGWLLFKLTEFSDVIRYIKAIIFNDNNLIEKAKFLWIFFLTFPIFLYYVDYVFRLRYMYSFLNKPYIYSFLLFLILTNGGFQGEFIYFQF